MGQSCLQKSRDMVLVMMSVAHESTEKIIFYYRRKEGYDYKGASSNDYDYEKEILLEEDADDFHAFDYDDVMHPTITKPTQLPTQVTHQEHPPSFTNRAVKDEEKQPILSNKKNTNDYESINQVENNLQGFGKQQNEDTHLTGSTQDNTSKDAENGMGLSDGDDEEMGRLGEDMNEEDQNALLNDIENMIKYDEDDEEVESRGMLD